MHEPSPPVLTLYRRPGCGLCDEARAFLQQELEERVKRGDPIAHVRELDIDGDPELQRRYGFTIPVFAVDGHEMELVITQHQVRAFLDRTLGRLA